MTTQIPYGPPHAEFPQFAAGQAQYPPAEHHASHAGTGYGAHAGVGGHAAAGSYAESATMSYPTPPAAAPAPVPVPVPAYDQAPAAYDPAPAAYAQPGHGPAAPEYSPATPGYGPATPGYGPAAPGYGPAAPGYAAAPGYHAAPTAPGYEAQPAGTYPPPAAYPTAPPWAPQETPAPQAEVAAPMSPPVVGGLLVPYPEEIQHAPRAQAPSIWPVAVFTFLFLVLGAVSAARRAGQARRGRNGVAPYWVTFAVTLVAAGFFWTVGAAAVGIPAYQAIREGAMVKQLEENVIGDGQLAKANVTASEADCRPAGDERVDGTRDYLCQLTLSDGRKGQVMVTADQDGNWKPLSR